MDAYLVSSLLDASYEAYASYEYSFLNYFLGSATWLSGSTYFKKDIQNNLNSRVVGQLVFISETEWSRRQRLSWHTMFLWNWF